MHCRHEHLKFYAQSEIGRLYRGEVVSDINVLKNSSDLNTDRISCLKVQIAAGSLGDARPELHDPVRRRVCVHRIRK